METKTYLRLVKRNAKGEVVKDTGLIPSHSYVIQFLELVYSLWDRVSLTATDVLNNETKIRPSTGLFSGCGRVNAGSGADTFGVLIGTNAGATAEDNENYKLDTKIEHSGTGEAGKMNHQPVLFTAPFVLVESVDFNISRAYINETGSSITVKEIAIYCYNSTDGVYHMLLRDVVADEVVDDAETLTVTYTLRTTV